MQSAGVQRMQGRGAGFMSAGLRGADSAECREYRGCRVEMQGS